MAVGDFYNSTAVVYKQVATQTAMGSVKKSYTVRIASVVCRLAKKRISEVDQYSKRTVRAVWRMYCSASAENKAIEESDRVTISSQDYEVEGIYNPANKDHHLEINLLEVR